MDVMKIAEKAELVYHDKYGGYLSQYMEETDLEPYVRKFAKGLLEEVANCIEHGNPELCVGDKDMAKSYKRNMSTRKYYADIIREIKIVD